MTEAEELEKAIAALEARRAVLGDDVVETMITAARDKLDALRARSAPAGTQRKQVTVLFADLSGFTAMAEKMDPEEVHATINALWEQLDAVITNYGGTVDKHMGDAVMALFGAPAAREDDPERAVRAALAMRESFGQFVEHLGGLPVQIRIGINTGPVLLGTVGTTGEYTAIGDTVNVARRLQHEAPEGGVLAAHATYRHVRGIFEVETLAPIQLKGKQEAVVAYVVQRAKPRAFRLATRGVEGVETRTIGRERELERLQRALFAVKESGALRIVTIVGEAGVGKSRLLYEFTNWIELLPDSVRFFKGRTDPKMGKLPYALIRDVFAFRFRIQEGDPAAVARQKFERGIVRFLGPAGVERAHLIGHLIGLDFPESPHLREMALYGGAEEARRTRDRAFSCVRQFFRAAAVDRPAVLFLEDVHWADEGTLDLIAYLAWEGQDLPLLIVALARPELFQRRPAWGQGWAHHVRLDLPLLSRQASHQLVAEILRKAPQLPNTIRDFVVDRAGGNPLYMEELVKVLVEDGVVVKQEPRWQIYPERLAATKIPAALTGILQARLDRLAPPLREVIQQAAVIGRIFWPGAIERLSQRGAAPIAAALDRLLEREWIRVRGDSAFAGEREFIFRHVLLHEVTYESVLRRSRRGYHAQVAAWLVERGGERVEEYAGLIGEHYERAGERAQAAQWYGRAGRQAQDTYAPEVAIDYYRKALGLLPEAAGPLDAPAQRVVLYEGLGGELGRLGRYAEAAEAYVAMRAAAEATEDGAAQSRAWDRLAWVQDSQGEYHTALHSAEQAEAIARRAGAQLELIRALHSKGRIHLELGDPERASALGEQALALSRALDAPYDRAHSLNLLGAVYYTLGRHERAARHMERALEIHRQIDNRPGEGATLNDLAETARVRGDYAAAVTLYGDALAVFDEIGHRDGEIVCRSNLGGARVQQGAYREAEEDLRQVIATAEPGSWFLSETYRFLAEACLGQGKVEEALAAAQRALALGQEIEQQEFIGGAWRTLGRVAAQWRGPVRVGDRSCDAGACFSQSLHVFTEIGAEAERARTLRAWAQYILLHPNGDRAKGVAMWQEAGEIFGRLGMDREVARMEELPSPSDQGQQEQPAP